MFTPEKIVIDGTRHRNESPANSRGDRTYYEIRLGYQETIILLPFRLFFLFGSLAMLRDMAEHTSPEAVDIKGFVHRDRLKLSKSTTNQYVYCTRLEIYKQARELSRNNHISISDCYNLTSWQVIENGATLGQESHWRLAAPPAAVFVTPHAIEFPDAVFQEIRHEYSLRLQSSRNIRI